jgi:iron complex transport system substrate-binding protein
MKIQLLILLLIFACLSCSDKLEKNVSELRIISLAPHITEILFALGLEDRVVGVTDYCKYPPGVEKKERIGGLLNPNTEKMVALKPDLLIVTESFNNVNSFLHNDRYKIVSLPDKKVADILLSIDSIGTLTGTSDKARLLISGINDSLALYKGEMSEQSPTAILVIGRDKGSTRNIGVSGPGAFINELWNWTGGRNAFPQMPVSYAQLNREDLLKKDPQIIIEFKYRGTWNLEKDNLNKKEWQDLQVSAVKNDNIFVISGSNFVIPGPRVYLLAKEYSKIISKYNSKSLQ